MQFALGPSAWDEIHHAIFKASKVVYSASYNNMPKEEVESLFDSYEDSNFTRTGSTAVELVHPDVDHVTVRWIPANTLFAITVSVIDQGLAQKYVYQNQGVSFSDSC
ncbi:hypothetical protein HID58_038297 [Brassica napus]|uniref:Uncharacterized protein n=1 Tax=Brassica napus TaxID=3708 RepID=A0ABQ8BNT6_BRANA|nr:hypothetical protein HID58_038297 [Brassica napus]